MSASTYKNNRELPSYAKHPRPCSTGGPHREQKLILRKSMLAPMLNKNLSRPGRRFHPPSPQPPASWRPCSSGNPFVQSKALNKRLGFRPPRSGRPGQASAPPRSTSASPLPAFGRKEGRSTARVASRPVPVVRGAPTPAPHVLPCAVASGGLLTHAALASPAGRAPPPALAPSATYTHRAGTTNAERRRM